MEEVLVTGGSDTDEFVSTVHRFCLVLSRRRRDASTRQVRSLRIDPRLCLSANIRKSICLQLLTNTFQRHKNMHSARLFPRQCTACYDLRSCSYISTIYSYRPTLISQSQRSTLIWLAYRKLTPTPRLKPFLASSPLLTARGRLKFNSNRATGMAYTSPSPAATLGISLPSSASV